MNAARVAKLVTHGPSCSDGLESAMVVLDALPELEVVFAEHGTPSLEQLPTTPGLLFCDISPPRARVAEFVQAGAVVLDHHKHARDIVEAFGARGHFADEIAEPGVSGALLAYRHVAGGGHSRAAGCQLRESDPYEAVRMTMAWACEVAQ